MRSNFVSRRKVSKLMTSKELPITDMKFNAMAEEAKIRIKYNQN